MTATGVNHNSLPFLWQRSWILLTSLLCQLVQYEVLLVKHTKGKSGQERVSLLDSGILLEAVSWSAWFLKRLHAHKSSHGGELTLAYSQVAHGSILWAWHFLVDGFHWLLHGQLCSFRKFCHPEVWISVCGIGFLPDPVPYIAQYLSLRGSGPIPLSAITGIFKVLFIDY